MDFADVRSHEAAKRAVLVALAGGHSIALVGPDGCGKTMLAERIGGEIPVHEVTVNGKRPTLNEGRLRSLARVAAIHVEVPSVPFRELVAKRTGTDTATIRRRVADAKAFRAKQGDRPAPLPHEVSEACKCLMKQAYDDLALNPRAIATVCAVARTIADLDESAEVQELHVAEAFQYRLFDRGR